MYNPDFALEFKLNSVEIRKLNKMYFKRIYKERFRFFSFILLFFLIFFDVFDWNDDNDLIRWFSRNLVLILFFILFQCQIVNTLCRSFFKLIRKLMKFKRFLRSYKFNFTNSFIHVYSPLGEVEYKWGEIEKAILTKDFFFLYIKEKKEYVISISNKENEERNIKKLIAFVENNVTKITKI